jgi:hypothetical protein
MGLDLAKLKRAQADVQARLTRGGPSMKFWKPQEGVNRIRILPPWTDEGDFAGTFWREVWQHWNVSEESGPILCPKKTAGADETDCPICDFVEQLRAQKSNVEAQELAKDLRAKVAYLMSIIDLADATYTAKDIADWKKDRPDSDAPFEVGDPKVQVYAATTTIYEQVASIVLTNEMDITDRDAGHNIILTKIGNKNKMLTRYTVQPDLKKTKAPLPATFELPDLSKIGRFQSYSDMTKLLSEGAGGSFKGLLPAETAGHQNVATAGYRDAAKTKPVDWVSGEGDGDLAAEMRASLNG